MKIGIFVTDKLDLGFKFKNSVFVNNHCNILVTTQTDHKHENLIERHNHQEQSLP